MLFLFFKFFHNNLMVKWLLINRLIRIIYIRNVSVISFLLLSFKRNLNSV